MIDADHIPNVHDLIEDTSWPRERKEFMHLLSAFSVRNIKQDPVVEDAELEWHFIPGKYYIADTDMGRFKIECPVENPRHGSPVAVYHPFIWNVERNSNTILILSSLASAKSFCSHEVALWEVFKTRHEIIELARANGAILPRMLVDPQGPATCENCTLADANYMLICPVNCPNFITRWPYAPTGK